MTKRMREDVKELLNNMKGNNYFLSADKIHVFTPNDHKTICGRYFREPREVNIYTGVYVACGKCMRLHFKYTENSVNEYHRIHQSSEFIKLFFTLNNTKLVDILSALNKNPMLYIEIRDLIEGSSETAYYIRKLRGKDETGLIFKNGMKYEITMYGRIALKIINLVSEFAVLSPEDITRFEKLSRTDLITAPQDYSQLEEIIEKVIKKVKKK